MGSRKHAQHGLICRQGQGGGHRSEIMHIEAHAVWRCSRVSGVSDCERLLVNMVF